MFLPCNIPLPTLVEWHRGQMQRNADRRQNAMQRASLKPDVASAIARREAAVQASLERLMEIEAQQDAEASA